MLGARTARLSALPHTATDFKHSCGGPCHVAHGGTNKHTSGKSLSATRGISSTLPTQSQQQNALNQN